MNLLPDPTTSSLYSRRTPGFVAASNFLVAVLSFSVLYNFPLFFSAVKLSPSSLAGSHLVPNSIALAVGSVAAGWYMRHTGRYWWLSVFMAAVATFSTVVMATFTTKTPEWILWTAIIPLGFGTAGLITSTLIALIGAVDHSDVAVATGGEFQSPPLPLQEGQLMRDRSSFRPLARSVPFHRSDSTEADYLMSLILCETVSYMFRTTGQVLGVSLSAALTQSLLTSKLQEKITGEGSEEVSLILLFCPLDRSPLEGRSSVKLRMRIVKYFFCSSCIMGLFLNAFRSFLFLAGMYATDHQANPPFNLLNRPYAPCNQDHCHRSLCSRTAHRIHRPNRVGCDDVVVCDGDRG